MKKIVAILLCVLILSSMMLTVFADDGSTEPTKVPSPTGTAETHEETKPNEDHNHTSPNTGSNVMLYAVVLLVALFGVVVSVKKLAKNHY